MTDLQRGIIALLKSAITELPQPLPDAFCIDQALPLIQKHSILTLAYDGAVRCGISKNEPAMKQMFLAYCKAILASEAQMRAVCRVCSTFDENHIDYMLLKGSRLKRLYPKPELRLMGDADILIRPEQYSQIKSLLPTLQFAEIQETDHELIWRSDALLLELHKRLIPSYNKDFYAYFGDGWNLAKLCSGTQYSMSLEDEWVYLFTHFTKHYRDGGIGCRHVTDLWIWRRTHQNMDESYIQSAMKKLQLDIFYGHMLRLLDFWFGDGPSDDILEHISAFVFTSGNWGSMDSNAASLGLRYNIHSGRSVRGKIRYILDNTFPCAALLKHKYPILQKAPWLLPAVWLVRPFYKLIAERNTLIQHTRNLNMMSRQNLVNRKKLLNYVGLDYHF